MEAAVQTYNTLEAEIESVKQFMQNEAFRYDGKLTWECSLDPEVNTSIIIPNLLIHTFVENAIKHGIFYHPSGGKVDISINKSSIGVLIMITDNGAKSEDSPVVQTYFKEKLKLLDHYLQLFNQKQSCRVSYQILDRSTFEIDRSGSRVLITLKF
ncbi:MAG: hypothetical protein ABFS38_09675 [Bacteroidota bacterium]